MKIFFGIFWILVLITVFAQFGSSKIVTKREESNYENGTNIIVVKPGILNVLLTQKNLTFKLCGNNCSADFLACYEPAAANQSAKLDLCDSKCGFYVNANAKEFSFMDPIENVMPFRHTDECYETSMKYETTYVAKYANPKEEEVYSCDPKIQNGMIQLNITKASLECPITIKNAKFVPIEVSTTDASSNGNPSKNNNPETAPSDNSATSKIIEIYFGLILVLFSIFILQ